MTAENAPTILLADDNARNLQVLADILRTAGYKVAVARDGARALKFMTANTPNLILLDIMMSEMDGFEVCRKIKADDSLGNPPVIFISALAETENKVKGFAAGAVDYITKPFQKEEVLARVKTHLRLKASEEKLKLALEQLREANQKLERAARTDSLTRLSNRRDIIEKMKYEKSRSDRNGKPFALVLCDIDDFKQFNDRHGHDCGDFVLAASADVIRSRVRSQDVTARWGGEEFLFLLPETDLAGGKVLAESVRAELCRRPFRYGNHDLRITMTFGVAAYTPGKSVDDCVKMADLAMYQGKKEGKDRVALCPPQ